MKTFLGYEFCWEDTEIAFILLLGLITIVIVLGRAI